MITIYGNELCSFCLRAKRLCERNNLPYEWHDTDIPENKEKLLTLFPETKTIPQIWWYGKYVGGYTEFASEIENTKGGSDNPW